MTPVSDEGAGARQPSPALGRRGSFVGRRRYRREPQRRHAAARRGRQTTAPEIAAGVGRAQHGDAHLPRSCISAVRRWPRRREAAAAACCTESGRKCAAVLIHRCFDAAGKAGQQPWGQEAANLWAFEREGE